jgi:hypothetical protein
MKAVLGVFVSIIAGGTLLLAVAFMWIRRNESNLFNWSPPDWEHPNIKDLEDKTGKT